jgi:hypothetical protein
MRVSTPVVEFLGVAIRIIPPAQDFDGLIAVVLEHRDPGLCVPLHVAADGSDIAVEWRTWARVLGLPALVTNPDGSLRDPFERIGRLQKNDSMPRRRGRATMRKRRGPRRNRRKAGVMRAAGMAVHCGEREIIARN